MREAQRIAIQAFKQTQTHLTAAASGKLGWADVVRQLGNEKKHIGLSSSSTLYDLSEARHGLFKLFNRQVHIEAACSAIQWWHLVAWGVLRSEEPDSKVLS